MWADVEAALHVRPPAGWKHRGRREWGGPCPVTGAGRTKAWVGPGHGGGIRIGCRACSAVRLAGEDYRAHVAAILGEAPPASRSTAPPVQVRPEPRSTAPADVWAAGVDPHGTPAWTYLVNQRRVWSPSRRLPASVRWLLRQVADGLPVLQRAWRLPEWAAGAVLYRYAAPGEADTWAVQFEPVDSFGGHRPWEVHGCRQKRPAARDSNFGGGRRVFLAAEAAPAEYREVDGARVLVCPESTSWNITEGPLDALAVAWLSTLGVCGADPRGAVVGVHGTAGLQAAQAPPGREIVAWVQADGPGVRAAHELHARCVVAPGVSVEHEVPEHAGLDWADAISRVWRDDLMEVDGEWR